MSAPQATAAAISPPWLDRAEYPFASHRATLAGGERIHYVDEGSGPALLFVHGTPTWSFEWRRLIRALSATHRCVAPDHLGFGLSDRPPGSSYAPESHAGRLRELVEQLDLRDVTLVVHDFGGIIGLPLAVEDPGRVSRLVVINSWMWNLGDDAEVRRAGRIFGGAFGRFLYERLNVSLRAIMPAAYADRKRLTRAIHAQYLAPFADRRARGLVLWPLARSLAHASPHSDRLWERRAALAGMPALIIWGTKDRALKPHHLDRWRTALPDAEVVTLEAGHWPHEEMPDAVCDVVSSFLAGSYPDPTSNS
ncbi:MAG TPA: alpha/beta fold hydrolase [Gemmatimonadales bacterium]|nr:alpha/beta fold hydrolase [Gemmatimonadales bacterium]